MPSDILLFSKLILFKLFIFTLFNVVILLFDKSKLSSFLKLDKSLFAKHLISCISLFDKLSNFKLLHL